MSPFAVFLCLAVFYSSSTAAIYDGIVEPSDEYLLPPLPYQNNALEPFIDTTTLVVHHQGHHRIYTDKLNAALSQWRQQVQRTQSDL